MGVVLFCFVWFFLGGGGVVLLTWLAAPVLGNGRCVFYHCVQSLGFHSATQSSRLSE